MFEALIVCIHSHDQFCIIMHTVISNALPAVYSWLHIHCNISQSITM